VERFTNGHDKLPRDFLDVYTIQNTRTPCHVNETCYTRVMSHVNEITVRTQKTHVSVTCRSLWVTCMNDLTGAKVLNGERILFNAFKDIYFTSKMKFENSLLNRLSVQKKSFNFDICGFLGVMIVIHNTGV
jgi:hypothetical protein